MMRSTGSSTTYRKSSIKPPEGYLFQAHMSRGGGLIEAGGAYLRGGGLFNLAKTMVSVLHKELEYKVVKLRQVEEVLGHEAEDQIRTSSC